jgi:hypothetical protein
MSSTDICIETEREGPYGTSFVPCFRLAWPVFILGRHIPQSSLGDLWGLFPIMEMSHEHCAPLWSCGTVYGIGSLLGAVPIGSTLPLTAWDPLGTG